MGRFDNKVVVIIGGTSGIGEECAKQFNAEGACVIIAGRNEEKGKLIIETAINPSNMEFYSLDISDLKSIRKFSDYVWKKHNGADVLFNNAGIYPIFRKFEETDIDEWRSVIDVNVYGMVEVCKVFINQLKENHGSIINNASIAGIQDFNSGTGYAYAASKSAVIKFSKMLAKNYAKDVRVNCICPGVIDTPLYTSLNKERMAERIPAGKVGVPEDVAPVVLFLASEAAKFVYGAVLPIDGGMTI